MESDIYIEERLVSELNGIKYYYPKKWKIYKLAILGNKFFLIKRFSFRNENKYETFYSKRWLENIPKKWN